MEKLVDEGLVKSIGVSNFSSKKLGDLLKVARIKPAVDQVELHPYFRNDQLQTFCKEKVRAAGCSVVTWLVAWNADCEQHRSIMQLQCFCRDSLIPCVATGCCRKVADMATQLCAL